MDKIGIYIAGIVSGVIIMAGANQAFNTDIKTRLDELERHQNLLINMLTYVPDDIPEVVKTIKPKAIK